MSGFAEKKVWQFMKNLYLTSQDVIVFNVYLFIYLLTYWCNNYLFIYILFMQQLIIYLFVYLFIQPNVFIYLFMLILYDFFLPLHTHMASCGNIFLLLFFPNIYHGLAGVPVGTMLHTLSNPWWVLWFGLISRLILSYYHYDG